MTSLDFKITLWRGVRSAVAAGFSAALLLQLDLTKPDQAAKVFAVAFIAGFITSIGKFIRDTWGETKQSEGAINKLPI